MSFKKYNIFNNNKNTETYETYKTYETYYNKYHNTKEKIIIKNIYSLRSAILGTHTSKYDTFNDMYDYSSITDMSHLFEDDFKSLKSIPPLDTSKVKNMSCMFKNCSSLKEIPHLNTSAVTDTTRMFVGCHNLTSVPHLDTSSVVKMSGMFLNCHKLTSVPSLEIGNVTSMIYMFEGCYRLSHNPIKSLDKKTLGTYRDIPLKKNLDLEGLFKGLDFLDSNEQKEFCSFLEEISKENVLNIRNINKIF